MAIFYLDSGSINDLDVGRIRATGSLFGSASFAVSASWAPGNLANINVSAGTTSNNVSQLIFSNANSHTFGLNSNTITVSYQAPINSYFELIPAVQGTNTSAFGTNINLVQPFVLPYDVSISYIKVPMNFAYGSTTLATTANTSIQIQQTQTYYANFYTAGSGASSKSIRQFAQASVSLRYMASASEGNNSNAQTVGFGLTWYSEGQTTSANTFTQTAAASSVFSFNTGVLTSVSAVKMIDIPFATSLAAGEYWVAFQRSSATATTGTGMTGVSLNNQYAFATQQLLFDLGQNTTNLTLVQQQPGVGVWSATNQGGTTNSIGLNQISATTSSPRIPFQFIRFA